MIIMKSKEVLELLQITRPTLTKYVKEGLIKVNILPNGRYDYDKDSVYKLFNKGVERKTYIYHTGAGRLPPLQVGVVH